MSTKEKICALAGAALRDTSVTLSQRYGVSDVDAWRTRCPVCNAEPRRDCRSHGNGRRYKGGREMHAGRYRAASEAE